MNFKIDMVLNYFLKRFQDCKLIHFNSKISHSLSINDINYIKFILYISNISHYDILIFIKLETGIK